MPDKHTEKLAAGTRTFIEEFKEFALKGNIIDLAVAVVIGAAFKTVIDALVEHFINPLIALAIPSVENLADWTVGGFGVGALIAALINFIAVALVLFIVIKKVIGALSNLRQEEEAEDEQEEEPSSEEKLLTEIRDLLKNK